MSSCQLLTALCVLVMALMLATEVQGCPRPIMAKVKSVKNPFKSAPPKKKMDISWPVNRPAMSQAERAATKTKMQKQNGRLRRRRCKSRSPLKNS
ncbi:hypothetical protein BOX15_Mlig033008g1 [Macrostomum lignano]|uniref:Uncharacterized protein n=1 Tax=Macrostomum lignano TaxID=282301 RepID=A0A267GIB9_9PLAT|nr:hypothetical protein BOX15_Mlig033008g1 [Macrostomum lignano]